MAYTKKTNWEEVKNAYQCGLTLDELVKEYDITKKTLQNRISKEKWEVSGNIKADIKAVEESIGKVSGMVSQNPEKANIIIKEVFKPIMKLQKDIEAKTVINNLTYVNLQAMYENIQSGVKYDKIGIGKGIQDFTTIPLDSTDFKNNQETINKAGIALGVIDKASTQVTLNNTNAIQNNIAIDWE